MPHKDVESSGLLTPPQKPTEGLPNNTPSATTKSTDTNAETFGPIQRRGQETRAEREDSSAKVQGEVLGVNQDKGLVWISLGVADGIKTRTRFKVRKKSSPDAPIWPPVEIGTIEIIRLIDRQTSEARILGLIQNDGPAKGDEVVQLDEPAALGAGLPTPPDKPTEGLPDSGDDIRSHMVLSSRHSSESACPSTRESYWIHCMR